MRQPRISAELARGAPTTPRRARRCGPRKPRRPEGRCATARPCLWRAPAWRCHRRPRPIARAASGAARARGTRLPPACRAARGHGLGRKARIDRRAASRSGTLTSLIIPAPGAVRRAAGPLAVPHDTCVALARSSFPLPALCAGPLGPRAVPHETGVVLARSSEQVVGRGCAQARGPNPRAATSVEARDDRGRHREGLAHHKLGRARRPRRPTPPR